MRRETYGSAPREMDCFVFVADNSPGTRRRRACLATRFAPCTRMEPARSGSARTRDSAESGMGGWRRFSSRDGLPEEAILQLDSDAEGNLWVGAGNRIYRVNKEQLDAFAEGRAPFVNTAAYGKEDGLPGIQCLPRVQSHRRRIAEGDLCLRRREDWWRWTRAEDHGNRRRRQ